MFVPGWLWHYPEPPEPQLSLLCQQDLLLLLQLQVLLVLTVACCGLERHGADAPLRLRSGLVLRLSGWPLAGISTLAASTHHLQVHGKVKGMIQQRPLPHSLVQGSHLGGEGECFCSKTWHLSGAHFCRWLPRSSLITRLCSVAQCAVRPCQLAHS